MPPDAAAAQSAALHQAADARPGTCGTAAKSRDLFRIYVTRVGLYRVSAPLQIAPHNGRGS
jgi:hypothetical protein